MIKLLKSLRVWGAIIFSDSIKEQLQAVSPKISTANTVLDGGYVDNAPVTVMVLHSEEGDENIIVRLGKLFTKILLL